MKNYSQIVKIAVAVLLGIGMSGLGFSWILNKKVRELEDKINVKRVLYQTSIPSGPGLSFEPTDNFEKAAIKSVDAVVFISSSNDKSGGISNFFGPQGRSSGSGVVISPDGYIVTNYHVVEGSDEVSVTMNDKTEYEAQVIATDPDTDIAVIKVEGSNLPTLAFSNSNQVKIGQWVLAVGNPFNLNSTVTAGIVSAKARNIGVLGSQGGQTSFDFSIESFIQTDAAVNPGNSGGALVNLNGELIGVNTAIATETGTFAGYSFAIPSNLVKKVVTDLIEYGVVQRGFIGVSINDINAQMAKRRDLKTLSGAIVIDLTANGAASEAGIKQGDVITHIQNRDIKSASELQEEIANYRPGDKIVVKGFRGETPITFTVILRNINGTTSLIKDKTIEKRPRALSQLGASFYELTTAELNKYNLKFGIKLKAIRKGSVLKRLGVEEGFIITKVDKTQIESFDHFIELLNNANESSIYIEGIRPNGKKGSYVVSKNSE